MGLRTKMRKVPICQLVCGYLPTFYTNRHEEMSVSETTRDRVLEQHLGSETHECWPPTITRCKNNTVVGLYSIVMSYRRGTVSHTGGVPAKVEYGMGSVRFMCEASIYDAETFGSDDDHHHG